MDLLKAFAHFIDTEKLFRKNDVLLLAVSGGVDSIVLCELCRQSGFQFIIAHCNFRLRGDESERDEKFVRSLGEQYQAPVVVKKFDTEAYASGKKISIQVAARELRYEWFHSLLGTPITTPAGDIRPSVLLTAHHADDNIETVLMNFYKGTGIQGLRGILPKQGKLVRPLLFATKKELQQFAQENNLDYVTDSSNLSDKYTRNYFRHQVIPLISKLLPEAEENMAGNIIRFRETAELYEQAISLYKKKLLEPKGQNLEIPVLKLLQQKPLHTIVYEIIKDYGFSSKQTAEAVALLQSDTGKFILSPTHRILKNRNRLIISPLTEEKSNIILIDEKDTTVYFEEGRLLIDIKDIKPGTEVNQDPATAVLDARDIRFPLLLRKWKPGDYFYPLGMQKKKKLARFFIDNKLSLADKEKTWVIESGKKIIWIVGQRIDDRFKVTEKTKWLLTISVN
ncbi:MAG: tRNA lysidine(34) synthetase TilS [Chitinophagaceae bacterium]|nr:tRNA lysidine(34) synthetase TilS [Chitinophagaceae bacterium]MCW5928871.1 tRNA lysidine(34) synthetase TilS [Chitinophagaceae bacterium]